MQPGKLTFIALLLSLPVAGLFAIAGGAADAEQSTVMTQQSGESGEYIKPTEAELRARLIRQVHAKCPARVLSRSL